MTAIARTVRVRPCAREGCPVMFQTPHGGPQPQRYCSPECHRLDKPAPARKPTAPLRGSATAAKRRPVSVASTRQRTAVADGECVVCGGHPVDPAHLVPRGLADDGDGNPLATIPLCRPCHRSYDEGGLSLLEHLEPAYRPHLAFAVARIGLVSTLRRVTNDRRAAA